jgi:hypothetical protein
MFTSYKIRSPEGKLFVRISSIFCISQLKTNVISIIIDMCVQKIIQLEVKIISIE